MVDIVERLHYAGYNDARLLEAANEIERLREGLKIASAAVENLEREVAAQRSAANEHRNAAMEADLRTQAAVRSEKAALADKVNISELRRIMTEWHQQVQALGFDGVPDMIASLQGSWLAQGQKKQ